MAAVLCTLISQAVGSFSILKTTTFKFEIPSSLFVALGKEDQVWKNEVFKTLLTNEKVINVSFLNVQYQPQSIIIKI